MALALNFLITILIELPIIALFFKRKKRQSAILMALLINVFSWAIAHIIFFTTEFNMTYVAIGLGIGEAIAFQRFLKCNWKKAIAISLIVNTLSFFAIKVIPTEMFEPKPGMPKTAITYY